MIASVSVLQGKLSHSSTNLKLTTNSKQMYSLVDKKHIVPLDNTDQGRLCGCEVPPAQQWRERWTHRRECHQLSFVENNKHLEATGRKPLALKKCRTMAHDHCECFMRKFKLHHRLRTWKPQGLNYCSVCGSFTRRKRGHNGRCRFLKLFHRRGY